MANFEQRVGEPKTSKCGTMTRRNVKVGNKLLGTIEQSKLKPGEPRVPATFWGSQEVMRQSSRENSINVTRSAVANLRTYGVGMIGVRFADGSTYVIALAALSDPELTNLDKLKSYYSVEKKHWDATLPSEEDRVANTMNLMRIGRRKSKLTGE
jgi:hypothetical protein